MANWRKPLVGFMKVNVGAVVSREQRAAAVGCVVRDNRGEFVKGSGGLIGLAPPVAADLWTVFYGLKLSWEMSSPTNDKRVVVETDSAAAVNAIIDPDPSFPFAALVNLIKTVMNEAWTVLEFNLIDDNANMVAKTVASRGLAGDGGIEVFNSAPACVEALIRNEA